MDPYRLPPKPAPRDQLKEIHETVTLRDDSVRLPSSVAGAPAWQRTYFGPMAGQPSKAPGKPMLRRPAFWVFGPFLLLFFAWLIRALLWMLHAIV